MKAQQLSQGGTNPSAGAIRPGVALVPEKIVQNGSFHSQPSRQQIIHFHGDENRQQPELNTDPDGSHQREAEETEARVRSHASVSSL
jgi:hypothetical protein